MNASCVVLTLCLFGQTTVEPVPDYLRPAARKAAPATAFDDPVDVGNRRAAPPATDPDEDFLGRPRTATPALPAKNNDPLEFDSPEKSVTGEPPASGNSPLKIPSNTPLRPLTLKGEPENLERQFGAMFARVVFLPRSKLVGTVSLGTKTKFSTGRKAWSACGSPQRRPPRNASPQIQNSPAQRMQRWPGWIHFGLPEPPRFSERKTRRYVTLNEARAIGKDHSAAVMYQSLCQGLRGGYSVGC